MILLKMCLAYKSCTICWRDTKVYTHVQYDIALVYQAQGYPLVCWSVCPSVRHDWTVSFMTHTICRIGTKLGVRVDFNDDKNFLKGQGLGIKGQGQVNDFEESVFGL